jgi:hypothetical protein
MASRCLGRSLYPVLLHKNARQRFAVQDFLALAHPTRNHSLENIEPEHEELSMNVGYTSGRIFSNHPEDQIPFSLKILRLPIG